MFENFLESSHYREFESFRAFVSIGSGLSLKAEFQLVNAVLVEAFHLISYYHKFILGRSEARNL